VDPVTLAIGAGVCWGGYRWWRDRERRKSDPVASVVNVASPPTVRAAPILFEAGYDDQGHAFYVDLAETPHLLVAGMTGSGKSTFVTALLVDLMTRYSPDEMRVVLIDPKRVELAPFAASRHVLSYTYDPVASIRVLENLVVEMERRYAVLAANGARKAEEVPGMPRIVVVVEELANLMLMGRGKHVEAAIVRLTSMARAVGIHLVLVTQRPSVDVITGLIKANVPARVGLATVTGTDSRVILDRVGAEHLNGRGDMFLMLPWSRDLVRLQGRMVADAEIAWATTKW